MMISDEERRKVAARLRELAGGYVTIGELESALGICLSSPEVDLERDARDLHRMADLIEPSEPEVKYVAEVKVDGEQLEKLVHDAVVKLTGIDRDALMELADEMTVEKGDIWGWGRRIREALGAES